MLGDRALQFPEGQILDALVDGQRQLTALLGRANALHVLDNPPEPVLDHTPAAALSGEPFLVCKLDAFLPVIVHPGEADHVRSYFRRGVITAVLALQEHAGKIELHDFRRLLRRQLPLEIHELALTVGESPS